ncbi:MAG: hypothetical protein US31_C0002G0102 [Berkelbacteria bacterium GW2011_GWA1_36_9]|uniref:Glycosyltransferase 2-like domain-containing protein n=1 Tax=Berkelbacteria bacterium GW2011_GWA1_36_9 TaxID=1618331 RepID=A0A0G0FLT0_9BACT|nr:MAG: hypothetical protein US31_C0002G0102 [Berkelbacteria bacterium GW2011_GWA1_36_9]
MLIICLIQGKGKMYKEKKVGVVVPAHNEEKMITNVIKTMPDFVDQIIIIDDFSQDRMVTMIQAAVKIYHKKVKIIRHARNEGVGASIVSGYAYALTQKLDVIAVMAGDAQMDPKELKDIINPIINGRADYVKGNRLIYGQAWKKIPKVRYLGNSVLSLLTKIASGYWHVSDSQTGYTAISLQMLRKIPINNLYKRYGFPNDLLVHLNIFHGRIKEIPIKPIYNMGGKSGIRLWKVIPTISWLLYRRFFWRLKIKYIIEDFHPLVFFYFFSILLGLASLILLIRLIYILIQVGRIPPINALALFFCAIMASQFLFFAMWFDMDNNKDLRVK